MKKQYDDHMRVVFGLRRQIRGAERRYNHLKGEPPSISQRAEAWHLLAKRHKLLEVLLAYQLATFRSQ